MPGYRQGIVTTVPSLMQSICRYESVARQCFGRLRYQRLRTGAWEQPGVGKTREILRSQASRRLLGSESVVVRSGGIGTVMALTLYQDLGDLADHRELPASRAPDIRIGAEEARDRATVRADKMGMLRVEIVAFAFDYEPPGVVAQVDSGHKVCFGQIDQVAIDRRQIDLEVTQALSHLGMAEGGRGVLEQLQHREAGRSTPQTHLPDPVTQLCARKLWTRMLHLWFSQPCRYRPAAVRLVHCSPIQEVFILFFIRMEVLMTPNH